MRKLTEADRARLLEYVGAEPEINLFIIGDIENFGFSSETVDVWANERPDGAWDSIVLRYFDNYVFYADSAEYDAAALADFLHGRTLDCISAKTALVRRLAPFFPEREVQSTHMCRCNKPHAIGALPEGVSVRRLVPEDADSLYDLMIGIEEFAKSYSGGREKHVAQERYNIEQGNICVGAFVGDRLISAAQTSASNSQAGMIVGVATEHTYRGRGIASAVVSELCTSCFKAGLSYLCLFYDNPEAGRIYHRIGFEDVGEFALFR